MRWEDGRRVYESASELPGVQGALHRRVQRARRAERERAEQVRDERGRSWGPLSRLRKHIRPGGSER